MIDLEANYEARQKNRVAPVSQPTQPKPQSYSTPIQQPQSSSFLSGLESGFNKITDFAFGNVKQLNRDINTAQAQKGIGGALANTAMTILNPGREIGKALAPKSELAAKQETMPTFNQVLGHTIGAAAEVVPFAVGLGGSGQAAEQLVSKAPLLSKLGPTAAKFVANGLESGVWGGLLNGAGAVAAGKKAKEVLQETGVGALMGTGMGVGATGLGMGLEKAFGYGLKNAMPLVKKYFPENTNLEEAFNFFTSAKQEFAKKFGNLGGKDIAQKLDEVYAKTGVGQAKFLLGMQDAELKHGLDFTKIKQFTTPEGIIFKDGFLNKGDAGKVAQEYYYRYGYLPKEVSKGVFETGEQVTNHPPRDFIKSLYDDVKKEAINREFMITNAKGETVPFTEAVREDYKPHYVLNKYNVDEYVTPGTANNHLLVKQIMSDDIYYKNNPELAQKYIEDWAKLVKEEKGAFINNEVLQYISKNKDISYNDASELVKQELESIYGRQGNKLASSLEKANTLNILAYNPDTKETASKYSRDFLFRTSQMDEYGYDKNNPTMYPYFRKIKEGIKSLAEMPAQQLNETGVNVANLNKDFERLERVILDKNNFDERIKGITNFLRTTSATKLSLSQIQQFSQAITNSALTTDVTSALKGFVRSFTEQGKRFAQESAATDTRNILEAMSPGMSEQSPWVSRWLKRIGMTDMDAWARNVNANSAYYYFDKMAKQIAKNPTDSFARSELSSMGLNVDKIIANSGKIDKDEFLKTTFKKVAEGQFLSRGADLPSWMSTNSYGKLMAQYKTFGYQQSDLVIKRLRDAVSKGQANKVLKDLAVLSIIAPLSNEVALSFKELITGKQRSDNLAQRYLDNTFGSLGILGDISRTVANKYDLKNMAIPVSISNVSDIIKQATTPSERGIKPAIEQQFGLSTGTLDYLGSKVGLTKKPKNKQGTGNILQALAKINK